MKIYVASSWRNIFYPNIIIDLKLEGHEVYDFRNPRPGNHGFSWAEIDPLWKEWQPQIYKMALDHRIAQKGFQLDFEAMKWAECCLLVLPSGRSAHTEAGWMKGAGKKVYVFMPVAQEPELMYKLYDDIFTDFSQLKTLS